MLAKHEVMEAHRQVVATIEAEPQSQRHFLNGGGHDDRGADFEFSARLDNGLMQHAQLLMLCGRAQVFPHRR